MDLLEAAVGVDPDAGFADAAGASKSSDSKSANFEDFFRTLPDLETLEEGEKSSMVLTKRLDLTFKTLKTSKIPRSLNQNKNKFSGEFS